MRAANTIASTWPRSFTAGPPELPWRTRPLSAVTSRSLPVDEHVGGRADPAGARVEGPVLGVAEDRDRVARVRLGERQRRGVQPRHAQHRDVLLAVDDERGRRLAVHLDPSRAGDDVRRGDDDVRPRDPAGAFDAEPAGDGGDADDARPRAHDGRGREHARSGGSDGGAGPAIDGNGSTRANARSTVRGGAIVFSRWRISDCCTSARSFGLAGELSSTAPATHTIDEPERRAGQRARRSSRASVAAG